MSICTRMINIFHNLNLIRLIEVTKFIVITRKNLQKKNINERNFCDENIFRNLRFNQKIRDETKKYR